MEFSVDDTCVYVLKASDNSASKNDVADVGRDDDGVDPQSFSETY